MGANASVRKTRPGTNALLFLTVALLYLAYGVVHTLTKHHAVVAQWAWLAGVSCLWKDPET